LAGALALAAARASARMAWTGSKAFALGDLLDQLFIVLHGHG
jgi:hypothetical protein